MSATAATANRVDRALQVYLTLPGSTKILVADKILEFLEREFPDLLKFEGSNAPEEPKFTIWWQGGRRQVISGPTIEEAFTRAGYGAGARKAIDWYDRGDVDTHEWSDVTKGWVKKQ